MREYEQTSSFLIRQGKKKRKLERISTVHDKKNSQSRGGNMKRKGGAHGQKSAFEQDFTKKKEMYPQPGFMDHMTMQEGAYQAAVEQQQLCKHNLVTSRSAYKNPPVEYGTQL